MQSESPPDKSIAAVEWPQGWSRDWGVWVMTFDRWEFPLLSQEEQSSSKHTLRTALHAGGSQHWPARGPHCYWTPLIQHPCSAFVTCYPILTVGHVLPAHNPRWRPRVDTGGYRSTTQLPLLRMGLQGRTLAVLRKFRVNWAGRDVMNMFKKDRKKMTVLFFYLSSRNLPWLTMFVWV